MRVQTDILPAVAGNRLWESCAPSLSVGRTVPVARRVLPRGILDQFALTYRNSFPYGSSPWKWNAWATLRISRSSPVIVITEKPGSSDFRALQISSRRTLRASLQDQTMVRVRLSLRERRWSYSACGKNAHRAQSLGRGHWLQPLGSIMRTTSLIRTPQRLLDHDLSRRLAAALSTSPNILRNQRFLDP